MYKNYILLFVIAFILSGCYQQQTTRYPSINQIKQDNLNKTAQINVDLKNANYSNKDVDVNIKPGTSGLGVYNYIELNIKNKTTKDIKVIWDETYFTHNGATDGRFMFEGIRYIDRENNRVPDIILSNSNFTKDLYPNALVLNMPMTGGWVNGKFDDGNYGVYLTLQIGNNKKNIKVNFTLQK